MQQDEYIVVMNEEEQFSIWKADYKVPAGWFIQPMRGSKEDCLEYINIHWTDMRPASLRRQMD
ncbi:MbtH family NRPS accessory protein [Acinetobacter sp. ACIN00229]|nr:MbtH family NRPS accessory protein [Acinetobacter sp. ACIN00229]MBI0421290.1 MbtH family NRPS accessory protein [Acinetobacter sp. ACIN00229]